MIILVLCEKNYVIKYSQHILQTDRKFAEIKSNQYDIQTNTAYSCGLLSSSSPNLIMDTNCLFWNKLKKV